MLGIFYEIPIQQYFLDYKLMIKAVNQFYMRVHLPSTIIFFIWLYHYKRPYYFFIRNGFLLANVVTLQYAAMPSMHFGNSLLIAVVTLILSKNNWVRIGLLIYPVFVLWMIVITGNHFFLDAILGGIIVLAPYPLMRIAEKIFPDWAWVSRGSVAQRKASVLMK